MIRKTRLFLFQRALIICEFTNEVTCRSYFCVLLFNIVCKLMRSLQWTICYALCLTNAIQKKFWCLILWSKEKNMFLCKKVTSTHSGVVLLTKQAHTPPVSCMEHAIGVSFNISNVSVLCLKKCNRELNGSTPKFYFSRRILQ